MVAITTGVAATLVGVFPLSGRFSAIRRPDIIDRHPQTLSPLDGRHFETSLTDRHYRNHRFRLHLTRRRFPPLSGRFLASMAWPVDPDWQQPLPCRHWSFLPVGTADPFARFSLVHVRLAQVACLFVCTCVHAHHVHGRIQTVSAYSRLCPPSLAEAVLLLGWA